MHFAGQIRQGAAGQFGFGHVADKFPEPFAEFVARVDGRTGLQQAGHGAGPELQQGAAQGKTVVGRQLGNVFEFLTQRFGGVEDHGNIAGLGAGSFQLPTFAHGQQTVKVLGLDGEKLQF